MANKGAHPRNEQDMVHWYDPRQLLAIGLRVILSYLLRERIDRRVMDALAGRQLIFDYSGCVGKDGKFWLDYVADVGDGYNSTYEVARQLARASLTEINTEDGTPLSRGHVLVMGGDQVYPAASRRDYDVRLRLPYGRAFVDNDPASRPEMQGGVHTEKSAPVSDRATGDQCAPPPAHLAEQKLPGQDSVLTDSSPAPGPDRELYAKMMSPQCVEPGTYPGLFAIPGNHDWYDGLASFTRLFCQERSLGGLQTYQNRSYFALKLPHNWWLLAIDVQLTDYIDKPQLDYFRRVIEQMNRDDNVILCMATPSWEPEEGFQFMTRDDFWSDRDSHVFLENQIFDKAAIKLWLSGDHHYYRRYQCRGASSGADGDSSGGEEIANLVTCGGGGAFLQPTHTRRESYSTDIAGRPVDLVEQKAYPDRSTSKKLATQHLLPLVNPRTAYGAGLIASLMYLVLGWYAVPALARLKARVAMDQVWQGLLDAAFFFVLNPFALLWLSVVLGLCYGLTPAYYKTWWRLAASSIHMALHLATIAALAMLGLYLAPAMEATIHTVIRALSAAFSVEPELAAFSLEQHEFLAVALVAVGGFLIGKLILAGYLIVAVSFFNVAGNASFAMLRVADYKSFLRLCISRDRLDVYAIGIDRVGRYRESRDPETRDVHVALVDSFSMPTRPRSEPARDTSAQ
ncbi:MAG: hypothetical protein MJE77_27690 [Proteobacteria bacterium]|nr:hypothetical protein [Pseudomonadota bacterium]